MTYHQLKGRKLCIWPQEKRTQAPSDADMSVKMIGTKSGF